MHEVQKQAEAGLKLFVSEDVIEGDVPAATAFKEEVDATIAELDKEAAALTGKDNKKLRQEKAQEKTALKNDKKYIDATKVVKGNPPSNGFFLKGGGSAKPTEEKKPAAEAEAAAAAADATEKVEKKESKKKKEDNAGISREERAELEGLKTKIIEKKAALKAEGMSGGQINKHEEIVGWVSRMTELKEKETPGSTAAGNKDEKGGGSKKKNKLDSAAITQLGPKQAAFDEYTEKLRTEFKYSKKEIAADPEYQELKAELDKMMKK